MQRRSLLTGLAGILAGGFAPAAVGSGILMPVKKIVTLNPDDYFLSIKDKYGRIVIGFKQNGTAIINGKVGLTDCGQAFIESFTRNYEGEVIQV